MVTYSYGKDFRGYVVLATRIMPNGQTVRREVAIRKTEKAAANYCDIMTNKRASILAARKGR